MPPTGRPLLRGAVWIAILLAFAFLHLYVALRWVLLHAHVSAELLTEVGDHEGRLRFLDLEPRPDTRHDDEEVAA
jgi:hypothetical protein